MVFSLKSLPSHDGDCFIISFGDEGDIKNIIVDGGRRKKVFKKLKEELKRIKENRQNVDLLVLTHIDEDHIQGLINVFKDDEIDKTIIKRVWFNSKELLSKHFVGEEQEDEKLKIFTEKSDNISFKQGISFGKLLENMGLSSPNLIYSGQETKVGEATLNVLSPNLHNLEKLFNEWNKLFPSEVTNGVPIAANNKEDYGKSIDELLSRKFVENTATVNGSSIAFSIDFLGKKILLLGDSFPSVVGENLLKLHNNEVKFKLLKVSHHGSRYNTNEKLLDVAICNNYLISTNGLTHSLPNKESLVRIACSSYNETVKTNFYFNYPNIYQNIFNEDEMKRLNIQCFDKEFIENEILEVDLWNGLES